MNSNASLIRLTGHDGSWREAISAGAALLAGMALLFAFHQVVFDSVLRGQVRRAADAAIADAKWRCGMQRGRAERADCAANLKLMRDIEAPPSLQLAQP